MRTTHIPALTRKLFADLIGKGRLPPHCRRESDGMRTTQDSPRKPMHSFGDWIVKVKLSDIKF